jgi:putative transposase
MKEWARQHGIHLRCIEPGKPNQNAYIERLNSSFHTKVLDAWVFGSLDAVRDVREQWHHAYHTERSHESLGRVPHSPSSRDQPPPPNRLISNRALDAKASLSLRYLELKPSLVGGTSEKAVAHDRLSVNTSYARHGSISI